MLLPHVVCIALVAGGRMLGAEQQAMRPGRIAEVRLFKWRTILSICFNFDVVSNNNPNRH